MILSHFSDKYQLYIMTIFVAYLIFISFKLPTSIMAPKPARSQQKDPNNDHKKKAVYDPSHEKTRVIQHNLVFVSGIPSNLGDQEVLNTDEYFGRYGTIQKLIINNTKKSPVCQAYVTYSNEVEASTAIIALDGFTMQARPLKASYGTTKYCTYFLKNYQCLNPDCFYLHHFEKSNQVHNKSDPRSAFIDQNDDALNIVCSNLDNIVEKIVERGEDEDDIDEGFPTLMQMIDFLIDEKLVNNSLVQSLINKCKSAEKSSQSKQSKSNSFSTVTSPKKSQCIQKDSIQQAIEPKKIEVQIKQAKQQKSSATKASSRTNRKSEQIEKIIEKLIIKQVWDNRKGKNNKSKLNFVENKPTNDQQQRKIKSIIQKHLIASH